MDNYTLSMEKTSDIFAHLGCPNLPQYEDEFLEYVYSNPEYTTERDWSTEPALLQVFYCLTRLKKPKTIIEVGTYKGKSAAIFAYGMYKNQLENKLKGRIITIDNNETKMMEHARKRFDSNDTRDIIECVEATSMDYFQGWVREGIDFIYLDGSHKYADVCSDFSLWVRHLKPDGIVFIHDTVARLERKFPDDYIFPLSAYNVINVVGISVEPFGHEWKGCGFITLKK
jgi:predicted O-methyltransferase YrrM